MTDEDLKCIVAFLRSIDPIENNIPVDTRPGEVSVLEKKAEFKKITPKKAPVIKTTTKRKKK